MRRVPCNRRCPCRCPRHGRFAVAEIKTSRADLRADRKWRDYLPYCDQLYFAVPIDFPFQAAPADTGLMVADRFGGEILRPSPRRPMAPARRNRQTLQFAHVAAARLYRAGRGDR